MTPDELRERAESVVGTCHCHEGYSSRGLRDPSCAWCNYGEDVMELARDIEARGWEEARDE